MDAAQQDGELVVELRVVDHGGWFVIETRSDPDRPLETVGEGLRLAEAFARLGIAKNMDVQPMAES
jgi:hypothetical protein